MRYSTLTHPDPATITQTSPLNESQVNNDAGGYVYQLSDWGMLDRFLIIGAEAGTFYATERKHVKRNYECLTRCLASDPVRTINRIVEVSVRGLAPKQDHAIFALAVAAAAEVAEVRHLALSQVNQVCRTGTTFFQFLEELKPMRKLSGRSARHAIGNWYTEKDPEKLAYQLVKYRQRNNWTHRDALRLAHVKPNTGLLAWAVKGGESEEFKIVDGFNRIQKAENAKDAAKLISEYNLPREAVPTQYLNDPEVWEALLPLMPLTAMIRNLGNMTKNGLLKTGSAHEKEICGKILDKEYLAKSRVHPISVLIALKTYQSGKSTKGDGVWEPVPSIVAALDDAFYAAFGNVEPTGKRILVGLDVSGSMGSPTPLGITSCEIGAAMSMIWIATEPNCEVMGFADQFRSLGFHRKMSLQEATKAAIMNNFGRTDCAIPMLWATRETRDFDAFVVITDNETYAGTVHPSQALQQYRKSFVKDAKGIVMATTSTGFTIADPNEPYCLDIAGFSADVPQVVASFLTS